MNVAVICEFNPFHKGHEYLFNKIKEAYKNASVICIMSGNFVQRGDFAVFNKFQRARAALEGGADLVIELLPEQALLSAEGFARSAVRLAESLSCCDALAFGAENDDIEALSKTAELLKSPEIQNRIKAEMKKGISYPAARKAVIGGDILDSPNNILACEYIKETKLECLPVKRIGGGHDSCDPEYSATEIRKNLAPGSFASIKNCERAFLYKMRTTTKEQFAAVADVAEGLENRLYEAAGKAGSFEEFIHLVKSKRYTLSRVRRIAVRAYLGIEGASCDTPFIRVLGFNPAGQKILAQIKSSSPKSIITKLSDCDNSNRGAFLKLCEYTDLYSLGFKEPLPRGEEQRSQIVLM